MRGVIETIKKGAEIKKYRTKCRKTVHGVDAH